MDTSSYQILYECFIDQFGPRDIPVTLPIADPDKPDIPKALPPDF